MVQNPASSIGASFRVTRNGKEEVWNVAIADTDQAMAAVRAKIGVDAAIELLSELNAGEIALRRLQPGEAKKE